MLPFGNARLYRTFLIEFNFFSIRNGFSLSEALDILLNEDTEEDIFIEPPYPHVDTAMQIPQMRMGLGKSLI